jgi:hypothetical protein
MNFLNSNVNLVVSPTHFEFSTTKGEVKLETKVWLSNDGKVTRVVAVGVDDSQTTLSKSLISLFDPEGPLELERFEVLCKFLYYGLQQVPGKNWMIRPYLVIKNDRSLAKILCGYQKTILSAGGFAAGAREVMFSEGGIVSRTNTPVRI